MPEEITQTQITALTATIKRLLADEFEEEITPEEARSLNRSISQKLRAKFRSTDLVNSIIKREGRKEVGKYLEKRDKDKPKTR